MQKGNIVLIILLFLALGVFTVFIFKKEPVAEFNLSGNTKNDYTLKESSVVGPNLMTTSGNISLSITSPQSGAVVTSKNITIKGITSPNAEVFVNEISTNADSNGNFSLNVSLDEGENNVIVSANDEEGDVAQQNLLVSVESFK